MKLGRIRAMALETEGSTAPKSSFAFGRSQRVVVQPTPGNHKSTHGLEMTLPAEPETPFWFQLIGVTANDL